MKRFDTLEDFAEWVRDEFYGTSRENLPTREIELSFTPPAGWLRIPGCLTIMEDLRFEENGKVYEYTACFRDYDAYLRFVPQDMAMMIFQHIGATHADGTAVYAKWMIVTKSSGEWLLEG
jgi:hypothetical protein